MGFCQRQSLEIVVVIVFRFRTYRLATCVHLSPKSVLGCGIMTIHPLQDLLWPFPRESQRLIGRCAFMHICRVIAEMDCVCLCMAEAITMSGSQTPDPGLRSDTAAGRRAQVSLV